MSETLRGPQRIKIPRVQLSPHAFSGLRATLEALRTHHSCPIFFLEAPVFHAGTNLPSCEEALFPNVLLYSGPSKSLWGA